MRNAPTFDTTWEKDIYGAGLHLNRYPFDAVVTFVMRNKPSTSKRSEVRILEVGCGSGNNLWFAAREGFSVTGMDGSSTAIEFAKNRFEQDRLKGSFVVGDFTRLPFESGMFDLAIDRCAITCCGFSSAQKAVREVWRTLRPQGRFFFNVYSQKHASYRYSRPRADGVREAIRKGTLTGVGGICFYSKVDVQKLFKDGWEMVSFQHVLTQDHRDKTLTQAEWRVVAEKKTT